MTTALHLPVCLNSIIISSWGQSERILQAVLVDGLTDSLTWSQRPVGTAWFSTPRPYVSNQSVSLALNGNPATPATQAKLASAPSALTEMPSPCNWLLFNKAWMIISLPNKWVHLTLSGPAYAPWIHSGNWILFFRSENRKKAWLVRKKRVLIF